MKRILTNSFAVVAALGALLVVVAAPVSAAQQMPFGASFVGTAGFTGPTSGEYNGPGVITSVGPARVHGEIAVVGAPSCQGGFTAHHNDMMTATDGSQLLLIVDEDACPTAPGAASFNCVGTYQIVTGSTGRFTGATGGGVFTGLVDFGSGTFHATYLGQISFAH